jgi:hypothetical protein
VSIFVSLPTRDVARARRFDGAVPGLAPHTAGIALRMRDVARRATGSPSRGVASRDGTLDTGVCHMGCFADPDGNVLILHRR